VWRHLAPGPYLLQVVDDAGRELGRYAFGRPSGEPAPEDVGYCGSLAMTSGS
jgi:hypothetical protein